MSLTITLVELRRFTATAKPFYVDTLLAHLDILKEAGILDNPLRLCHFMGQCASETGGFTILRESLAYRPQRMRQVWPARFRNASDEYLASLCADQVKLADAVYGGRMGNRKGTSDGYDYRGGGWIQTTGRYAVEKYCEQLGVEASPQSLDDPVLTLRMACLEWVHAGCNKWADRDDVLLVSKAINTGSATSNIIPVGLQHRETWTERAKRIWGEARHVADALVPPEEEEGDGEGHFVIPAADPPAPHPDPLPASGRKAASVTALLDTSDRHFAILNRLSDLGSRVATVYRRGKQIVWTALGGMGLLSQCNTQKGTANLLSAWVHAHPFLFAAICVSTVLVAVYFLILRPGQKFLVTAYQDGRYKPRG